MHKLAALSLLAIPLLLAGCDHDDYGRSYGAPPPGPPAVYGGDQQGYGYDVRQQGHRDGMEAAYRDMNDRRSPDPRRHNEFRRPPVDGRLRDDYRNAFADGYNDAYRRGYNGPPRDDDRRY